MKIYLFNLYTNLFEYFYDQFNLNYVLSAKCTQLNP